MKTIGELGEEIIAQWLQQQNYLILHQRWRCRWGEIDLIAQERETSLLAFVEVKTRSPNNWDDDGLLAINMQKQGKIYQTAQLFFSEYPHLVDFPCRFDVALVRYQKNSEHNFPSICPVILNFNVPIYYQNYQFIIKDYLQSAF